MKKMYLFVLCTLPAAISCDSKTTSDTTLSAQPALMPTPAQLQAVEAALTQFQKQWGIPSDAMKLFAQVIKYTLKMQDPTIQRIAVPWYKYVQSINNLPPDEFLEKVAAERAVFEKLYPKEECAAFAKLEQEGKALKMQGYQWALAFMQVLSQNSITPQQMAELANAISH